MKNTLLLIFIIFFISGSGYSCGTVEGWYDYYFDHIGNEDKQLYALTFIQCEPILVNHSSFAPKKH